MLLLLILMVPDHFQRTVEVHFPLKTNRVLVIVLQAYLKILLIAPFKRIEFLMILYLLINHYQQLYKVSKFVI